jgi:cell fate (sporulation/competence/biofilm development) regulator YlbF (YheA/YmcA/DUF963 family)
MLDMNLKLAAKEFIRYLNSSKEVQDFQAAEEKFNNDPEVSELHQRFTQLAQEFQQKQATGSVTQEEINTIKQLQKQINDHPATQKYAQKQQELKFMLQDCNSGISEILGLDFSDTAATSACC